jgi:hypothetical protein
VVWNRRSIAVNFMKTMARLGGFRTRSDVVEQLMFSELAGDDDQPLQPVPDFGRYEDRSFNLTRPQSRPDTDWGIQKGVGISREAPQ